MKRVTSWPQAVLGLAFSWGALMGWAAAFGALSWPAFALYASAFCWTVGYDTIYAQQDARDDAIVGIRSTARLFGSHARVGVAIFYALTALFAEVAILGAGGGAIAQVFWVGFCSAPDLAGITDGRREPRHRAAAVQVEPRRRADPVRRPRAERVGVGLRVRWPRV